MRLTRAPRRLTSATGSTSSASGPSQASLSADAEARVAARIGRAAEADLVPGPGMRVERGQHAAHDDAPGVLDVELRPRRRPDSAPSAKASDDARCSVERRGRRRSRAPRVSRGLVESLRRRAARSRGRRACRRSGSRPGGPSASFSSTNASTGMRGSASWASTTSQNAPSAAASASLKKRSSGTLLDPVDDDPARQLIPVLRPARGSRSRGSGRASAASSRAAGAAAPRGSAPASPRTFGRWCGSRKSGGTVSAPAPSAAPASRSRRP